MNCDEVQAHLSEYLDKALAPARTEDVEDHLASCPRCRAEAASLADCIRQVGSLPTVDPPLGFAERVMARVRQIETKPSLWERLLFPLRIKIPIHATAVVLISILAIYLLEKEHRDKQAQPAFGVLKKTEQAPASGALAELDAAAQKKEKARGNEIPSREVQSPPSESKRKEADQAVPPQSRMEESTALHDRRVVERKPAAEPPPTTAPGKTAPATDEAAVAGVQSSVKELRAGGSAAPDAPERKKRSTAGESGASTPSSTGAVTGSRSAPPPKTSDLHPSEAVADVDLVIRRAQASGAQRRDNLDALGRSTKAESAPRQKDARLGQLLPAIPESTKPQHIWLTIPRAQYDQLKRELLVIGSIESEFWLSSREKDAAYRSDDRLRIKVSVLPPEAESRLPAAPADR